ncbi:Retrotransposon gag domain [Arabidopsis suecica]|uniref:Retrotransposon gag domain n=1 Tax=Arabidopsis suecica TaxID=45249 RepID=A0A8T1XTA1_ARASU|nr:Retrotransposon gag domain [Arabidopsis suecica]
MTGEDSKATASGKPTEITRRRISPYDLSANDNPGSIISRPLLRGDNYEEWAINLETALYSRKKFGFLDGSIKPPTEDSPDYEDWKPINALIVSWIKMTIEPKLLSNISHKPIARDLWEHIRKRYRVSNGPRIQQLRRELANCQQVGLSIETYYGRLTKLWDSYNCYRPPLTCVCGNCTCDLSGKSERQREEDKVHDFLMGLDEDTFGIVRSNLMSLEPLPTLEFVYLKVTQDEDARIKKKKRFECGVLELSTHGTSS